MKKLKGQVSGELVVVSTLISIALIVSFMVFGGEFASILKQKSPSNTFKAERTLKFENPEDLATDINMTVGGTPVTPPIEKVIKQNIANGAYVQTSGSSGKLKDLNKIMKVYTEDIGTYASSNVTGAQPAFLTALSNYKTTVDNINTRIIAGGVTPLEVKIAMIELKTVLATSQPAAANLQSTLSSYLTSLPASKYKTLIDKYTNDMLGFPAGYTYTVSDHVYQQVLGQAKNNTLAQDNALAVQMYTDFATYDANTKAGFDKHISVVPIKNFSQDLAPNTYNSKVLCSTLGSTITGNACTVP